jgi:hypothetical protein
MNLAERYKSFRCFKMEIGMESTLIPYQSWTAELLHMPADIDFDMECLLFFQFVMGLGLNIDSHGVCVLLDKTKRSFPPYGPDWRTDSSPEPLGKGWLTLISGKKNQTKNQKDKAAE